MAGEKISKIYCWQIKSDKLNVYVASSSKGAVRVGLSLKLEGDCIDYFKDIFPKQNIVKDEAKNRPLIKAVEAALNGKPLSKELRLDIRCSSFQYMVWNKITHIPLGQTRTYGQIASSVGKRGGARAIGQAMNRNPLPLIFP